MAGRLSRLDLVNIALGKAGYQSLVKTVISWQWVFTLLELCIAALVFQVNQLWINTGFIDKLDLYCESLMISINFKTF